MSLNSEFHSRIVFSRTEFSYYLSAEFLEFFRCTQNNVFNYTFAIQKTGQFLRLQICFELFCCVQWLAVAQCTRKIKWHPWGSLSLVANYLSVEWRIVCRDACFAVLKMSSEEYPGANIWCWRKSVKESFNDDEIAFFLLS